MSRGAPWRRACAAWCAVGLLHAAAVGTATGRRLEDAVFVRTRGFARVLSDAAIATVSVWTLAGAGLLAVVLVARRGDRRAAAGVVLLLVGANAGTWALSHLLQALPLDGESQRSLGEGFFPSGHAAAAMSTACALVAASPARHVRRVAGAASAGVSLVAVSLLAPGNHYASDVLGALLLTAGWQALLADAWSDRSAAAGRAVDVPRRVLVAVVLAVVLTCVVFGVRPDDEPELAVASAVVTACAFLVGHASLARQCRGATWRRRPSRTPS